MTSDADVDRPPAREVTLPWGQEELQFSLPEEWRIAGVVEPAASTARDAADETRRSLSEPIGCPQLRELARAGRRIAVVIDDATRPTPVAQILPEVLAELQRAGVSDAAVTVVTALGVHRPMRADEIAQRLGPPLMSRLRWENHDCDDMRRLVRLGTTTRGTPIWINKTVAEAEVIVSIGCIEPHVIAGFGGGYKNLVPGVAGRQTIARNHALNCTPKTVDVIGRPIEQNPMRLDLEDGGRMLGRPVFIVNAVLNGASQVACIVSGDPVAAHRAGVHASAALCGVPIGRPADVVIAASHPMDQDFRQGLKALANTIRAVRPGGTHLTFAHAREGLGMFGVARHRVPGARRLAKLLPALLQLAPRLKIPGVGEEDRFFVYFALQAMRRSTQLIYAPTVPLSVRRRLPFVEFADSVGGAIQRARRMLPGRADVLVFPHGGTTFPIVSEV